MTMTNLQAVLRPGDVLAVRGGGLAGDLIRLGQALAGKPNVSGHIAVMHHWNGNVPWGLEGKPAGVGWVDLRAYAASRWTLNNCGQPGRTDLQRVNVAANAKLMIGTAYDWQAIADDTLRAFHMNDLFSKTIDGTVPGHVVCSSYAAFLYERAGWAHPMVPDRDCEPGDWDEFIIAGGWNVGLR
jgi:hypothetical protein